MMIFELADRSSELSQTFPSTWSWPKTLEWQLPHDRSNMVNINAQYTITHTIDFLSHARCICHSYSTIPAILLSISITLDCTIFITRKLWNEYMKKKNLATPLWVVLCKSIETDYFFIFLITLYLIMMHNTAPEYQCICLFLLP